MDLIPACLRVRFGVSEILTSLMLVYVAQLVLDYLARGPWRDPKGINFPQSVTFDPSATLPQLFGAGRLHVGALFALVAVLATAFVLGRTLFGYRLRVTGEAPRAARFAGFDAKRTTLAVFAISGGLAGLAGIERGRGPDRPAAALDLAGLRLHRDHGGLSRPPQPVRHPRRLARRGADLHRRRERADPPEAAARSDARRSRACSCSASSPPTRSSATGCGSSGGEGGGRLSRRERARRRSRPGEGSRLGGEGATPHAVAPLRNSTSPSGRGGKVP